MNDQQQAPPTSVESTTATENIEPTSDVRRCVRCAKYHMGGPCEAAAMIARCECGHIHETALVRGISDVCRLVYSECRFCECRDLRLVTLCYEAAP